MTTKERAQFEAWWQEQNGYDDPLYREWAVLGWMARAEQSTETPQLLEALVECMKDSFTAADGMSESGKRRPAGVRYRKAIEAIRKATVAEATRPVGTPEKCPKCGGLKRKMPVPALGIKCSDPWHDDPVGTPEGKKP